MNCSSSTLGGSVSDEVVVVDAGPSSPVESGVDADEALGPEPPVVPTGALGAVSGSVVTEMGTAGSPGSGASADEPLLHAARAVAAMIASAAAGARRICIAPT
jgi:hypothetical protein